MTVLVMLWIVHDFALNSGNIWMLEELVSCTYLEVKRQSGGS